MAESYTNKIIEDLKKGDRTLNGKKIFDLYKNCPSVYSELKQFLKAYAGKINGTSPGRFERIEPNEGIFKAKLSEPLKGYSYYSDMYSMFHKSQSLKDVLSVRKREARLYHVWKTLEKAGLVGPWKNPKSAFDLMNILVKLSDLFKVELKDAKLTAPKKGSRHAAQYKNCFLIRKYFDSLNGDPNERKVFNAFSSNKKRKDAYRVFCEIIGSVMPLSKDKHGFMDTGIKHEAAILDKYGIVLDLIGEDNYYLKSDPYVTIFITLSLSEFGKRNSFTLDKQKHGNMNPWLSFYIDHFSSKINYSNWGYVFALYPCKEFIKKMQFYQIVNQYDKWESKILPLTWYLNNQFNLGVETCVNRDMLVPRSGTTNVDSGGYNSVTGCWNNALRHIKWLSQFVSQNKNYEKTAHKYDGIFKCMKLLAGDQMQWANYEKSYGGQNAEHLDDNDKQMEVFKKLINMKIRPWTTLLYPNKSDEVIASIVRTCNEVGIDCGRWLGRSKLRKDGEVKAQSDQVCGVSVPTGLTGLLSGLNWFGKTDSTMK